MILSWPQQQELEKNPFPVWIDFSHLSAFHNETLLDFSIFSIPRESNLQRSVLLYALQCQDSSAL